jgi:hypothetical protein
MNYLFYLKKTAFGTLLLWGCWLALNAGCARVEGPAPPAEGVAEATAEEVHQFCGSCHAYPPPDSFPRSVWRKEVEQGYNFFAVPSRSNTELKRRLKAPPIDSVVAYYENRAPKELPLVPKPEKPAVPYPVRFDRSDYRIPAQLPSPAISNVNLVHLWDDHKLDLLACEMRAGKVLAMKPYDKSPTWQVLGEVPNPAHAEVVDLDGDGIKDILVANLGNFTPTDSRVGSVVWLRGRPDGSFVPITLLKGVGRVADVQAGDFRGVGKLDLIVAVFGWQTTGEILYLENKTVDWDHPVFEPRVLDDRHGAIHLCKCDLNNDQKLDFVALISQEHETVVAFLNEGGGRFRKETIYVAPHPAVGSTGIQMVDLNGDGKLDVLLTNGDVLDQPYLLKPYHGIHWLENKGTFPFTHHHLTAMYGVHRAVAADLRGNGRLDVVACSFLPAEVFPQRKELGLDSVIVLEQTAPGQFVRHSLETVTCDHVTCAAGAWNGDGKVHLVLGNFCISEKHVIDSSITLWKNRGR